MAKPLMIQHTIEPELAKKVLGRLNEVRDANDQAIAALSAKIKDNSDINVIKGLVAERENLLQKRKKLLLSNLLRIAVEDLVESSYLPSKLLDRMDATGQPRMPELGAETPA